MVTKSKFKILSSWNVRFQGDGLEDSLLIMMHDVNWLSGNTIRGEKKTEDLQVKYRNEGWSICNLCCKGVIQMRTGTQAFRSMYGPLTWFDLIEKTFFHRCQYRPVLTFITIQHRKIEIESTSTVFFVLFYLLAIEKLNLLCFTTFF